MVLFDWTLWLRRNLACFYVAIVGNSIPLVCFAVVQESLEGLRDECLDLGEAPSGLIHFF